MERSSSANGAGATDPVTQEIIRYALQAVVDEMSVTLARSAFSINIKTRLDMSCAVFDRECRLLAQSEKICQPGFVGALVMYGRKVKETWGARPLRAGDILVVNDPYLWATHLPDIALFAPLLAPGDASPAAYLMCIGHHSDTGGKAPGGYVGDTTEVFQEGLIIPPVRLVKDGEVDEEILELVLANVRTREDNIGDFMAQIASIRTGQQRYAELLERYGRSTLEAYTDAILEHNERRFGALLAEIPEGRYAGEDWLDNDGVGDQPIRVPVELAMKDGVLTVDLGSAPAQLRGPFNCTPAQAYSKAFYAIKAMIDPDGPVNEGCYRRVKLLAPEGTMANPRRPAPVAMGWEAANRILEGTLLALAQALPNRALAQCKRTIGVSGYGGMDPVRGEPYAFFEALGGGYGGRATKDGIDGIQPHTQNTADAEVEEMEASFPVRVERFELIADSEGAGRYRGGLGICKEVVFASETRWSCAADGREFVPRGIYGGGEARGLRYVYAVGRPDERVVEKKMTVSVPPDTPICIQTPGGGGYGRPHERAVDDVVRDVRQGKVSRERARAVYGVAIVEDARGRLSADAAATAALRSDGETVQGRGAARRSEDNA